MSSPNNGAYNPDGGEGGNGGAFNLSQGGLIAIIVVVAGVIIFGVVSATLFFVAKKRQWEVRKSIRGFSRRFTGGSRRAEASRRGTVRMQSPPGRHKAGAENRDVEKGLGKQEVGTAQTDAKAPQDRVRTMVPESWSVGPQGGGMAAPASKKGGR